MNDAQTFDSDAAKVELLKAQLAQSQRLAALGTLLGTTTHEFNNILMTIINYAKLGLRHRDEASRTKALEKILDASNRASRITTGILSMSRNRSQGLEPTMIAQVVEEVLILLEREMRKHKVRIDKRLEPTPPAMANASQLQQVFMNLMINARQAMPSGGVISLKVWHDAESDMVCLMVRDNGRGIPPDKLPHIFDPYFSTKQGPDSTGKGGTGLGLANCKEVIEAHNGRIRVDSTPGVGAAFIIKIPAVRESQQSESRSGRGTSARTSKPAAPSTVCY